MKQPLKNPLLHLVIGIVSLLLLYFSNSIFNKSNPDYTKFNTLLNQKETLAEKTINELITNKTLDNFSFSKKHTKLNKEKGLSFYILENDELNYWSDRSIYFSPNLNEFKNTNGLVELKNGWYQYLIKESNRKTYLALILIKHNFKIKNKYLKNSFHNSFGINDKTELITKPNGKTDNIILSNKKTVLFGLEHIENDSSSTASNNWFLLILFFLGYFTIISFISKKTRQLTALRNISPLIVIAFIILSRFFLLYFHPFTALFDQELFSPTIFAQSALLPSLGDLIISTVLFSLIIYYLARAIQKINPNNKIIVFVIAIACSLFPLVLATLLEGIITNSKINFDINYLLDLNTYSFAGIGSITLLFIALILFIKISIDHFLDKVFNRNQLITIFWIISLLSIIIGHFFIGLSAYFTSWILLVILVILAFSYKTT